MEFNEQELIKSPLNYTGGKFKLLPQILPYIPNNINTFVDLFCGGGSVAFNVKANNIICNDIESKVIELLQYFKDNTYEQILNYVFELIKNYNLSRSDLHGFEYYGCSSKTGRRIGVYNDDKYIKLRAEYNKIPTPQGLYTISSFAFNNQIRFNKNNEFNMPCGKQDFNKAVQNKLKIFKSKNIDNIKFTNKDFKELNLDNLNNQDLIYCDPPYLVTCASYNEQDGWNETHEKELIELLDKANEKGIRFTLSNVLENKGKSNDILKEWCQKYNTYHLNNTYGNCNYHAKDKSTSSTDEVLITNYAY